VRNLFKIIFSAWILALLCSAASAQFIGYTTPQTVYQVLAPAGTTCSSTYQTYNLVNFGNTQHWVFISFSGGAPVGQNWAQLFGLDGNNNVSAISDTAQSGTGAGGSTVLTAQGNFPKIQLKVFCAVGAVTYQATYMGASAAAYQQNGNQLVSSIDKVIFNAQPANASSTATSTGAPTTPFGNSAGFLVFKYGAAGPAGSTMLLQCFGSGVQFGVTANAINSITFPISTTANPQIFSVPPGPCPYYIFTYTSGGASATSFDSEYVFQGVGPAQFAYQYNHVVGTTATTIKAVPGIVHTLSINTGAAGTVSLFDLPAASCTGTPATNQVAIVTATATTLQTFIYDAQFLQGICAKASVAMDYTVSFQ
jgi:hypothetical protein